MRFEVDDLRRLGGRRGFGEWWLGHCRGGFCRKFEPQNGFRPRKERLDGRTPLCVQTILRSISATLVPQLRLNQGPQPQDQREFDDVLMTGAIRSS